MPYQNKKTAEKFCLKIWTQKKLFNWGKEILVMKLCLTKKMKDKKTFVLKNLGLKCFWIQKY